MLSGRRSDALTHIFHSIGSPKFTTPALSPLSQKPGCPSKLEESSSGAVWDLFRRKLRQQKAKARVWNCEKHARWQLARATGTLVGLSMPIRDKGSTANSDSGSDVANICCDAIPERNSC